MAKFCSGNIARRASPFKVLPNLSATVISSMSTQILRYILKNKFKSNTVWLLIDSTNE